MPEMPFVNYTRQDIAEAVTAIIKAANLPGIGTNVVPQYGLPTDEEEIAAGNMKVYVYTLSDTSSSNTVRPKRYTLNITTAIEIRGTLTDGETVAFEVDAAARSIEDLLLPNEYLETDAVPGGLLYEQMERTGYIPQWVPTKVSNVLYIGTLSILTPLEYRPPRSRVVAILDGLDVKYDRVGSGSVTPIAQDQIDLPAEA